MLRRLGWDRNPLRRRVDRIQTVATAVLLLLVLVVAPAAGVLAARLIRSHNDHAAARLRATGARVTAVVVSVGEVSATGAGRFLHETVRLRWTDQAGRPRSGPLVVADPLAPGATRTAWIDGSGALADPPPARREIAESAGRDGVAIGVAVVLLTTGAYAMTRRGLARVRERAWEADWTRTAPTWCP